MELMTNKQLCKVVWVIVIKNFVLINILSLKRVDERVRERDKERENIKR